MESIAMPHLPHQIRVVGGLYKDVKNASFLRQQLLEGNSEFEYAFLDATALISKNHVLAACFRAINDQLNGRLKSRNVHSEIVFSLSPNNNIAESFRRFGIQDNTTNVLAIKITKNAEVMKVGSHLDQHVEGDLVAFSDDVISGMSDPAKIKKIYKVDISDMAKKSGAETARKEAEAFVLGAMALKGS